MEPQQPPAVRLDGLRFDWKKRGPGLLEIDEFLIGRGETLFLYGPSGSGKTTLLNLLAGVLLPTQGSVEILGRDITRMRPFRRDLFRARHIGVIFQQLNLIPYLDVLENVMIASHFAKLDTQSSAVHADELFETLGMQEHLHKRPTELSIGQQQRVAVARALVTHPEILIADEPTSALDSDNREVFMQHMLQMAAQNDTTVIFVSHDRGLQEHFDRHHDVREFTGKGAVT
ncbi:MAG: ABC transporter ATP-binding protein [Gammaproteobacteria bacterium]